MNSFEMNFDRFSYSIFKSTLKMQFSFILLIQIALLNNLNYKVLYLETLSDNLFYIRKDLVPRIPNQ